MVKEYIISMFESAVNIITKNKGSFSKDDFIRIKKLIKEFLIIVDEEIEDRKYYS